MYKRQILGGNLEGTLGASLERDYSGRHEIRHSEAGSFYRNTERGNWRLEASNSKDNIRQGEGVSFDSKTTPTKQTDAQADYTLRRGDSTNVSTAVRFGRSRQSSTGSSQTEYFPTEAYALRSEESRNESLSKSLSAEISNYVNIQRKKKVFGAMTTFSIDDGSTLGHSRTQPFDEPIGVGLGVAAFHGLQLRIGDMLEGNVEVFADFRLVRHDLDHVVGEPRRIGVMQADPLDTPDAAQLREQIRQPAAAVEIDPVIGRVLRDDHQFAHAAGGQPPRFVCLLYTSDAADD